MVILQFTRQLAVGLLSFLFCLPPFATLSASSQADPATYVIYKTAKYLTGDIQDEDLKKAKATIEKCSLLNNELKAHGINEATWWLGINALAQMTEEDTVLLAQRIAWLCVAQEAFLNLIGLKGNKSLSLENLQQAALKFSNGVGAQTINVAQPDCDDPLGPPEPTNLLSSCQLGTAGQGFDLGKGPTPGDPNPASINDGPTVHEVPGYMRGPCAGLNPLVVVGGGVTDGSETADNPPKKADLPKADLPKAAPPKAAPPPSDVKVTKTKDGAIVEAGEFTAGGSGSASGGTGFVEGKVGSAGGAEFSVGHMGGVNQVGSGVPGESSQTGAWGGAGLVVTWMPAPHEDGALPPEKSTNKSAKSARLASFCQQELFAWFASCIGAQAFSGKGLLSGMTCTRKHDVISLFPEEPICSCQGSVKESQSSDSGDADSPLPQPGKVIAELEELACCPADCLVVGMGQFNASCDACQFCGRSSN